MGPLTSKEVDVAIVGGGPFGLTLAIELGRRGVSVALYDAKPSTAFNPQANATQARTMEYFRRLGFADEIRALGLPGDYPTDIAYFTRYASHELTRFRLPASRQAKDMVSRNDGSWSAAEAPHRISQKFVEPVLHHHADEAGDADIRFGWQLTGFDETEDHVMCRFQSVTGDDKHHVKARYLIGGDGARSFVRRTLGVSYTGEYGKQRHFFGGQMYAIYLRCPTFYEVTGKDPAWMNWVFNPQRRAFMAAVDGRGEFAFHTQLKDGENEGSITDEDARKLFAETCGMELDCEILSHMGWTAGHSLVADRYGGGRIWFGGDAAHLFTPAGGLGYNTAVEDAVNLGWKLAATLKGQAGPALLPSYQDERRPVALRNTAFACGFADSVGNFIPDHVIEEDSDAGAQKRRQAGDYLNDHAQREFNIPGITFGSRYDGSPVLPVADQAIPEDRANLYQPTGLPGGRPPHWWFDDGTSLYDRFGFDWTLIQLGPDNNTSHPSPLINEAARRGLDLKSIQIDEPRLTKLYGGGEGGGDDGGDGALMVLIRPDQMVGWRGTTCANASAIWDVLLGFPKPHQKAVE
ncbi:MAG: FAD-dependent oxidoreductase [Rhizobiaceae bacterium]